MLKLKNYSISMLIAIIVTSIGLCVSACIFAYTNINDNHLQTFVFGIILLSVLISSTILSRNIKQKGMIHGGIFGILYCLLLYFSSAIAYTGLFMSNTLIIYLGISFVSGIIGGVIGVNI